MGTIRPSCIGLALAASALAQDLAWRLPELGAAEFTRQTSARSAVAETAAAARTAAARAPVPDAYLPQLAPPPWLCQAELDREQQAVLTPPRDLRDVLRAVALDLAVRGSGSWRFARVPPFGDLAVSGRIGPLGADGSQQLTLTVDRRPAAPQAGDGKAMREALAAACAFDVSGSIAVQRQVDAANGLVREYVAVADLVVAEDKKKFRRLELRDAWHFVAVRDNQDADFRARVAAAIGSASAWIKKSIDGLEASWLADSEERRSYGSGRIALAALTLLHAEVPAADPVLQQAFAALRRRKLIDTYSLGTALMAMSQRYAPPREAELVRSGELQTRTARVLADADHKLAERWLQTLLGNRDTRVDPAEVLRFDYDGGGRYDNSLSQYGLLGLDAAALCGLPIAPTTWLASAQHFLAVQCPAGGRSIDLDLVTHRELALAAGDSVPRRPRRTPTRGFAYQDREELPYGSMTAASTAGLVVARAGAARAGNATAQQLRTIDDAIDAGFAWIAAEFTARNNPGFVAKADRHWYYWLYSLERACELAGIARLQGRDWYHEGALQLLSQQQKDGSFRAERGDALQLEATCFAVLFLKKSTLAAITGR